MPLASGLPLAPGARIYEKFIFAFPYSGDVVDYKGLTKMMDLIYLGLGIVFFGVTWALVLGFERLRKT